MANATDTTATPFAEIAMHHATRAKAGKLDAMLRGEYPKLSLEAHSEADDEGTERLTHWEVTHEGDEVLTTDDKQVPELAEILDACAELGIDPTTDDEEAPRGGSVVAERYRAIYREVSTTGTTNGDWLAELLTAETTDAKGNLNVDDLAGIFAENGLNMGAPWAVNRSRGWQGRFRMSGRLILEKLVALNGNILVRGQTTVAPDAFVATMQAKHAKWLAKEQKRIAEAEAAVKSAVEGA